MENIVVIKDFFIVGLIVNIVVLIFSQINLKRKHEHAAGINRLLLIILGLYLTFLFSSTISPVYGFSVSKFWGNINLVPFKILSDMHDNLFDFIGKIFMFVPIGILFVLLSNKCQKLYVTLYKGMGISLLIEFIQLFENRGADIDDIILSTIGTFVGYIIGRALLIFIPSLRKKIGILKLIGEGRYKRKYNDTASINALCILIIIGVFTVGLSEKNIVAQNIKNKETVIPKVISEEIKPANKQISAEVEAKDVYFMNVTTNTLFYEKSSDEKIAPASTTKMLTALTVLDYCDINEIVQVGDEVNLISANASRAWVYPGSRLNVKQLLDGLLLPSGNDAAYALAVFTGRKIAENENLSIDEAITVFMDKMNLKAKNLGAENSNFVRPDGYDIENQYTTAHDLALIAKGFLKCNELKNIAGSYSIYDEWLSGESITYQNTNELINPNSQYYYKTVIGLKTGTTENAGCCLVSAAEVEGDIYICVVMGSTEEGRWEDSIKLYNKIEDSLQES
ncbi:VanZ family protein [Anaerovorax odorimutans]|uniref:VanZ family protein n=1 Tax=Anaerovorax odorimutans TaxID=109327 RepID=UPI00042713BD|nr:VanZ family protein [Anaerovorax odorimutans]